MSDPFDPILCHPNAPHIAVTTAEIPPELAEKYANTRPLMTRHRQLEEENRKLRAVAEAASKLVWKSAVSCRKFPLQAEIDDLGKRLEEAGIEVPR